MCFDSQTRRSLASFPTYVDGKFKLIYFKFTRNHIEKKTQLKIIYCLIQSYQFSYNTAWFDHEYSVRHQYV